MNSRMKNQWNNSKNYFKNIKAPYPILLLILLLIIAILGLFWQPYDPQKIDIPNRFALPSLQHWMGLDYLGRDILSLFLYGLGQSIGIAFLGIVPISLLAITLGFFAVQTHIIGNIITAFADFLFAFPIIITAIFLAAHFGPGRYVPIISIALFSLPVLIKLTRSQIFTLKSADFIEAARALGMGTTTLFFKHYLPNIRQPLGVQISVLFTIAILTEAGLSYLGFGTSPDQASLGKMLFDAQRFSHLAPHAAIFPGTAIMIIVLNINWLIDSYNHENPLIELRS